MSIKKHYDALSKAVKEALIKENFTIENCEDFTITLKFENLITISFWIANGSECFETYGNGFNRDLINFKDDDERTACYNALKPHIDEYRRKVTVYEKQKKIEELKKQIEEYEK